MEGEPTVIVVSVSEPPTALIAQLRDLNLNVVEADFHDAEEEVEQKNPELVLLSGARGATELSTLLEDQEGEHPPKMVVAAERRELSRLYGLNRDIVISLLATEMNEKVVAKRVAAVARQLARKRSPEGATPPSSRTSAEQASAFINPKDVTETADRKKPDARKPAFAASPKPQLSAARAAQASPAQPSAAQPSLGDKPRASKQAGSSPFASLEREKSEPQMGPSALSRAATRPARPTEKKPSSESKQDAPGHPFRVSEQKKSEEGKLGTSQVATAATGTATARDEEPQKHRQAQKAQGGSALPSSEMESPQPPRARETRTRSGVGQRAPENSGALATTASSTPDAPSSLPKHKPQAEAGEREDVIDDGLVESIPPGADSDAPHAATSAAEAISRRRVSRPGDDPERFLADIDAATQALESLDTKASARSEQASEPDLELDEPGLEESDEATRAEPVSLAPEAFESLRPSDAPDKQVESTREETTSPEFDPRSATVAAQDASDAGTAESEQTTGQQSGRGTLRPDVRRQDSVPALPSEKKRSSRPALLAVLGLAAVAGIAVAASQGAFSSPDQASVAGVSGEDKLAHANDPSAKETIAEDATAGVANGNGEASADGGVVEGDAAEGDAAEGDAAEGDAAEQPSQQHDAAENPFRIEDANLPDCEELAPNVTPQTGDPLHEASLIWEDARGLIVKGDLKRANVLMCKAVAINPQSPAVEGLALMYSTRNSPALAMKWVDEALKLRPEDRDTINLKGDVYSQLGQTDKAIETWLRAMNVDAESMGLRRGLAKNYLAEGNRFLKLGNYPRAERMLRRAIGMDPDNVLAPTSLAQVFLQTDRPNHAAAFARRALELNEYDPKAHVILGDVARQAGDDEQARAHYERALQVRSDFWPAKRALAELEAK